MKMEKKRVQQETKREHRRVMVAVDEFLKVNQNIDIKYTIFLYLFLLINRAKLVTHTHAKYFELQI